MGEIDDDDNQQRRAGERDNPATILDRALRNVWFWVGVGVAILLAGMSISSASHGYAPIEKMDAIDVRLTGVESDQKVLKAVLSEEMAIHKEMHEDVKETRKQVQDVTNWIAGQPDRIAPATNSNNHPHR